MLAEFIQLPKEGETIGPYFLRKVLSASILGTFYSATHKGLHEDCLIHIIPEALLRADSRFMGRYQEIIERQKRLSSSAILTPVESVKIEGNLIVRYKGGNFRSLSDVIAGRKEPLPSDTVRHFLKTLAEGLSDAAKIEQGHYFMTPDFLFLNEEGEIRLAGLGLFQSISYESFERFVSGAVIPIQSDRGRVFNAIEILSPEIRNFKSRDHRSDFYCLGMCAYYLLTGTKPERKWTLPTRIRKELDAGWNLFISHCLEPKPSDRFPHYRSFIRDLENLEDLTGEPRREGGRILRTLNQIPIPQFLMGRVGFRSLLLLRLGLLGLAGIMAVGTGFLFYKILIADLDEPDEKRYIRQVSSLDEANLSFHVTPSNAQVSISGPENGRFFVRDRDLHFRGRSGSYKVEVAAPRRETRRLEISLVGSEPQYHEVALPYAFGAVRVEAAVGTHVYVEADENLPVYLGTVAEEAGLLIGDRLLVGDYRFTARHPAFLPVESEPLSVGSEVTGLAFEQVPRPTELLVRSEPEGALVFIDNVRVGLTPLRVEGLEVGYGLSLRIEKEGYRNYTESVSFEQGESKLVNAGALQPKIGVLDYDLTLPMEEPPPLVAFLFTIGEDFYRLQEEAEISLPEGDYLLKLEHPDFYPLEREISIMDQETQEVLIAPEPRPVRLYPRMEGDFPVRFQIDDEPAELNEQGFLEIPSFQSVKVAATIRGFHSVIQYFEGEANERLDWEVPLKPLPGAERGENYTTPYFAMSMLWLEPERFQMGSPINEFRRLPNEDNLTTVRMTYGYWISRHEITQKTYLRIMGENPSKFAGDNHPVDSVTWSQAMLFCKRLTEFESEGGRLPDGYVYRLPTEAEWEWAARAGTSTPFSFGSVADPAYGNFQGYYAPGETVGRSAEDRYGTLPVGSFDPNAFGLYDVHGNVAEWTLDRYWDRHPGGMVYNFYNNVRGTGYPIRGGSWRDSADRVRSAAREGVSGNTSSNSVGFRVVLAPVAASLNVE